MNVRKALIIHYTASLERSFKQFRLGIALFFLGAVMLYSSHSLLEPSLSQELAVLASLLVGGVGFVIAMMAHVRMVISRLIRFFRS